MTNMHIVIIDAEDQFGMHRNKGFDRKIKTSHDLSNNMFPLIFNSCNGCSKVSETFNLTI